MSAVPKPSLAEETLEYLHSPECDLKSALGIYEQLVLDPRVTDADIAAIGRGDRFFLLTHILHRPDAIHPWLYDRCREVEAKPDECLDLWARFHYKSTIITFAGAIQEILNNPDITIAIFSHTKGIARGFLEQIKRELESNDYLKSLYPEILWQEPSKESSCWSLDRGIVVKRKSNPKEATAEAWGLVDGQPTSRHFNLRIYDDTVSEESVGTADQIAKTTSRWELSQNLGDGRKNRRWHIGTRYDQADTYRTLIERSVLTVRLYAATDTGTMEGKPIFMTQEAWDKKCRDESSRTIACQMLQNPSAGNNAEFSLDQFRLYEIRPTTLNVYIVCDYAGSRKSGSNRTAYAVIGMDAASNFYLLDGICHRLKLSERWKWLKFYHRKWSTQPGIQSLRVGYERYGAQSDIEHFEQMMRLEKYSFLIEELNTPRDGEISKDNRIRRLQPKHEAGSWWYPYHPCLDIDEDTFSWIPGKEEQYTKLQNQVIGRGEDYLVARRINHKDENGKVYNLIKWFLDTEYLFFPTSKDKDFFDAMARIDDMEPKAPIMYNPADVLPVPED